MSNIPNSKPRLSSADLHEKINKFNIDRVKFPVILIGIRGYYADTMGVVGKNDIGIYDDAFFIDTPSATASFNFNTDPSIGRPGMARLIPGLYYYKIGMHNMKKPYKAFRQYGRVTVIRDGSKTPVTDTAAAPFYIDIHKGGYGTTSSLGCQTVPPSQWDAAITLGESELKRNKQTIIPYLLIEN
jgi:lysozyme